VTARTENIEIDWNFADLDLSAPIASLSCQPGTIKIDFVWKCELAHDTSRHRPGRNSFQLYVLEPTAH
jgi:hypothetical protein